MSRRDAIPSDKQLKDSMQKYQEAVRSAEARIVSQEILSKPGDKKKPLKEQEFAGLRINDWTDSWKPGFAVTEWRIRWSEVDQQFMWQDQQQELWSALQTATNQYDARLRSLKEAKVHASGYGPRTLGAGSSFECVIENLLRWSIVFSSTHKEDFMRWRRTALLVLLSLAGFASANGQSLSAADAKNHVGEKATVCGKVASERTATSSRGEPTFINLDAAYPNQIFTILIWGENRQNVGTLPQEGFLVCATGTIQEYRGVPEIVVRNAGQLGRTTPTGRTAAPSGTTAECRDGTYSYSQHRQGTCSHHGGVAQWLQ